jgi:regulator of nonsense transcripts 2
MAFRVFQKFLSDFVHHNVELCACLLETCGRYLYLTPYTHDRLEKILDTVIRLRRAKNLDYRQQTALDEAYFAVKPPERSMRKKKAYTDIQLYVRHLLLSKMTTSNVDNIIRQLRKLPWNNREENVEGVIVKSTMKLARAKYSNVPLVTDCLSGLSKYHPNVIVRLVDSVIEELCRGLASPHKREQQRLISYVRLLSELFNYASISSQVVFDVMYLILSYGYETDAVTASQTLQSFSLATASPISLAFMIESIFDRKPFDTRRPCDIDAPTDCFRVQLICEMLQACGMYFVRGLSKMKLDDFMVYFQKYLLCKPALPSHVEFSVLDMFDNLEQFAHDVLKKEASKGGKGVKSTKKTVVSTEVCFKRFTSLDEVCAVIEDLETKQQESAKERRQLAVKQGVVPIAEAEAEEDEDDEDDDDNEEDEVCEGDGGKSYGRRGEAAEDEEEEEDDEEEEEDEDGPNDDDGDISAADAARLAAKRREVEEDEEFEKAFKSLMLESVESAKPAGASTVRAGTVDRMAIPAFLPRPKNVVTKTSSEPVLGAMKRRKSEEEEEEDNDEEDEEEEEGESSDDDEDEGVDDKTTAPKKTMVFKLLGRDTKGRVETRQLLIPEETKIAKKILAADEMRRLEKEKLKEKVLMYEMQQQSGVDNNPVQYLGGRDHFSGKGPTHRTIESSKWQQTGGATEGSSTSGQHAPVAPTGNTLNLSDFLAESGAAEARRFHTSAGRGTVGGNVSATVHGQGGGGGRGRGGYGGGRGYGGRG